MNSDIGRYPLIRWFHDSMIVLLVTFVTPHARTLIHFTVCAVRDPQLLSCSYRLLDCHYLILSVSRVIVVLPRTRMQIRVNAARVVEEREATSNDEVIHTTNRLGTMHHRCRALLLPLIRLCPCRSLLLSFPALQSLSTLTTIDHIPCNDALDCDVRDLGLGHDQQAVIGNSTPHWGLVIKPPGPVIPTPDEEPPQSQDSISQVRYIKLVTQDGKEDYHKLDLTKPYLHHYFGVVISGSGYQVPPEEWNEERSRRGGVMVQRYLGSFEYNLANVNAFLDLQAIRPTSGSSCQEQALYTAISICDNSYLVYLNAHRVLLRRLRAATAVLVAVMASMLSSSLFLAPLLLVVWIDWMQVKLSSIQRRVSLNNLKPRAWWSQTLNNALLVVNIAIFYHVWNHKHMSPETIMVWWLGVSGVQLWL